MTASELQRLILRWYRRNGRRELPWRKTLEPYKILVSEIMLQQTQVPRVLEKYQQFLRVFPTIAKLANASPRAVLETWQGLGYNRRALFLQRAAQKIQSEFHGAFPRDPAMLETLPGVGKYTARAVSVFAWNRPEAFIETNIRRVFIHFFFPRKKKVSDGDLLPLIEKALWRKNPRRWYWALMDYGALALKGLPNPNRKSAHYARQSPFLGSRRYARAKALEFLLERRRGARMQEFVMRFRIDPFLQNYEKEDALAGILSELAAEGFIKKRGDRFRI
ncbi:MAG: A/G-specific adenine glycosylase [Patescibacteria group bacterium]